MEPSAVQENVSVKAEPCEACITDKPSIEESFVKDEPLLDDVCVKDSRCDGVSIKAEPSCSDVSVDDESLGVSAAAAAAELYADHVVKDELVLGPVLVERRMRHAPTGPTPQKTPTSRLETFQCAHCQYATFRKPSLISHLMKHTSEKVYKCYQCTFSCSYKSLMQVHVRTHTGEKPYTCEQCSYASAHQSDLRLHVETHSNEKRNQLQNIFTNP
ncbi:zinc finger protein 37-like [Cydia amplana]|uniref:zinc finger protein 37-like n=1 Tax=Cydia amplana TaxID=1869771 RepID=UPI002FE5B704